MDKLPAQMTVVAISKPGGPEVLEHRRIAIPEATAHTAVPVRPRASSASRTKSTPTMAATGAAKAWSIPRIIGFTMTGGLLIRESVRKADAYNILRLDRLGS